MVFWLHDYGHDAGDIDYVSPDPDIPPERDLVQFNTSSWAF